MEDSGWLVGAVLILRLFFFFLCPGLTGSRPEAAGGFVLADSVKL